MKRLIFPKKGEIWQGCYDGIIVEILKVNPKEDRIWFRYCDFASLLSEFSRNEAKALYGLEDFLKFKDFKKFHKKVRRYYEKENETPKSGREMGKQI
jgi:hypothetical protein